MRFLRQDVLSEQEILAFPKRDIGFCGEDDDLDDRTRHSVALTRATTVKHYAVKYDPETFTLRVGGKPIKVDDLESLISANHARSIVLDATSLEFPELLYLLHAYCMLERRPRCGMFYVEPAEYAQRDPGAEIVLGNAFNLSMGFKGRSHLPLFSRLLSGTHRAHLVAFLGFEGDRLRRVLDADDGHFYQKKTLVFGVPPFQASWDLHAVMANSTLLSMPKTTISYCGANNPRAAYQLLKETHAALPGDPDVSRLCLAPFGTKPMAIGAALYCQTNEIYTPLYDYPLRRPGRTAGVHRRHWYEVDL